MSLYIQDLISPDVTTFDPLPSHETEATETIIVPTAEASVDPDDVDPLPDTSINDSLVFVDGFWELASGGIWQDAPSSAVLIGADDAGDIFLFDGQKNVTAHGLGEGDIFLASNASGTLVGGEGGDALIVDHFAGVLKGGADADIIMATDAKGTLSAGSGADIVLLERFSGTVSLGNDLDGDVLLISGETVGMIHVYGFDPTMDVFVTMVEGSEAALTESGVTYSVDGETYAILHGVTELIA